MSLDGYVAGPDQSEDNPLGVGGMDLHQWVFKLEAWRRQQGLEGGEVNASTAVVQEAQAGVGATVMGRNMFGGGPDKGYDSRANRTYLRRRGIRARIARRGVESSTRLGRHR